MSSANHARGETEIEISGVVYTLRPTFDACKRVEKMTGRPMFALAQMLSDERSATALDTAQLIGIVEAGLAAGPDKDAAPRGAALHDALMDLGLAGVFQAVCKFILGAIGADRGVKPQSPTT